MSGGGDVTDEPLCSCGTELRVQAGGFAFCTHCDRPHTGAPHTCRACDRYDRNLKRRYTETSG